LKKILCRSQTKQIQQVELEVKQLKQSMNDFEPTITSIEDRMRKRDSQIEKIKENMNNVEDIVFRDFCEQIGVRNIRQYEERELRYVSNYLVSQLQAH
jgi:structural maintenance of chromosome 1